jgi:SAM-dependent methyltransferase
MFQTKLFCQIDKNGCIFCRQNCFQQREVIDQNLAETWELIPRFRRHFNEREGNSCSECGMSKRVRMLLWSIRLLLPDLKNRSVLHFNQINHLTPALQKAVGLVETIHSPAQALGAEVNGLSNQDLTQLTFPDNHFDLAVHSETLEHIHDYTKALREVERVLKPGGYQIYTIPLIHSRRTRRRIGVDESGRKIHILPLSSHGSEREYPVVWEFGKDFLKDRREKIYQIHYDNYWHNRTIFSVVEKKHEYPDRGMLGSLWSLW